MVRRHGLPAVGQRSRRVPGVAQLGRRFQVSRGRLGRCHPRLRSAAPTTLNVPQAAVGSTQPWPTTLTRPSGCTASARALRGGGDRPRPQGGAGRSGRGDLERAGARAGLDRPAVRSRPERAARWHGDGPHRRPVGGDHVGRALHLVASVVAAARRLVGVHDRTAVGVAGHLAALPVGPGHRHRAERGAGGRVDQDEAARALRLGRAARPLVVAGRRHGQHAAGQHRRSSGQCSMYSPQKSSWRAHPLLEVVRPHVLAVRVRAPAVAGHGHVDPAEAGAAKVVPVDHEAVPIVAALVDLLVVHLRTS